MKIHEYQARDLLAKVGVPVPAAKVVNSADEAEQAFRENGAHVQVVKAQVFAGGRGKAGFVRLVKTPGEARSAAEFMLTNRMVSVQTGPEGISVKKLLVASAVDILKEIYVGITVDRNIGKAVLMASAEGGMDIEKIAAERPDAIVKEPLHPFLGLQPFQAMKIAKQLDCCSPKQTQVVGRVMLALAKLFVQYDCTIAEINPLVVTAQGEVLVIDAKLNFDDNALFRHPEIAALADDSESSPLEVRAAKAGLNYVKLDGTIGCLVNGAGLAMATMDVIKLYGGSPANFLDVGGGVKSEGAIEAFRIILSDPKVNGVLVNIFGGIAKCDLIAEALITAGKEVGFKVPVVVRLEGTNADIARKMLDEAKKQLPTLVTASDLNDAAQKIVAATKKA